MLKLVQHVKQGKKQHDILNTSVAQNTKKYKKNANKAKALFAFSQKSGVFRGSAPKRMLEKRGSLRGRETTLAK